MISEVRVYTVLKCSTGHAVPYDLSDSTDSRGQESTVETHDQESANLLHTENTALDNPNIYTMHSLCNFRLTPIFAIVAASS